MRKEIHEIPFAYRFDSAHKGAPYTINGEKWMNAGQFKQIARVAALFGRIESPDHLPYNEGSDIPELHESVKSSKSTLVNMVLGHDLKSSLDCYFATTASTVHSWVIMVDEQIVTYIMDNAEFREFSENFGSYDKDRQVVRYKADSTKMIKWFEGRL